MSGLIGLAQISDALKNYYIDAIRYQMDERTDPLMAMMEKTAKNIQGDQIVRYLRYGKNGGTGNRIDSGAMPIAGSRKGKQITTDTKNLFGTMLITDKVIKASKGPRGSFISFLETTLEELMADAKENFARQIHGDGSGTIATAKAAGSSTVTVALTNAVDSELFYEGMILDIFDTTGVTQRLDAIELLNVDRVNGVLTFASAVGTSVVDGDIITVQGSKGLEITGLDKVLEQDTTIYGLDRSANKWFNANVIDLSGAIDEIAIQQGIDTTEIRSGKTPDLMMASYGVRRAYMEYMLTYKRNTNTLDVKGGFKAIDFNGVPMVASKYRPTGRLSLLNTTCYSLDRIADWTFIDENGSILTRKTGYAQYEAVLAMYADVVCDLGAAQTDITNITEA